MPRRYTTPTALHTPPDVFHVQIRASQVKCGGSLDMWESSGWISNLDPYGWFQWYHDFDIIFRRYSPVASANAIVLGPHRVLYVT